MNQTIISVDSQILSSFMTCEQKYKYTFIDNLRQGQKPKAMEKGDLMHKILEVYYGMQVPSDSFREKEIYKELTEAGFKIEDIENNANHCIQTAAKTAPYFASKMNLPQEELEEIIYQFKEYTNYYKNDLWKPLAVEEVGTKVIYEDEHWKIVYTFKIDLVAQNVNIIAPFDHKTSSRRSIPNSLSNQFIGYCFGLGVNHIIINKIGFQKTLKPNERFNRFILTIDNERIEEWKKNTVHFCIEMQRSKDINLYPMRFTSCNIFDSGCPYSPICEASPEGRENKIERDFKMGESWDPARSLERS